MFNKFMEQKICTMIVWNEVHIDEDTDNNQPPANTLQAFMDKEQAYYC